MNNVDRSVAVSAMLTVAMRPALAPAVPMHTITAPEAGTGKSYLQDVCAALAMGERCPVIAVSDKPDETEKRLTGAMLAQVPIIALDNVSTLLLGDLLCQATERPMLLIRPLGTTNMMRIANSFSCLANGNNLVIAGDVVRRCVQCRLDAGMECPDEREFTSDPVASVLADRGRYLAAAFTIGRAYVAAGLPGRLPQRASYPGWSDLVRSALVWLGWPDPVDSVANLRTGDPRREARAAVFDAWTRELVVDTGYRGGELADLAEQYAGTGRAYPALFEALHAVAPARLGQVIDRGGLGNWLRHNAGTIAAGHRLEADRSDAARPRWRMTPA